jgi:O-antigen/teichoic acid export membrane protein
MNLSKKILKGTVTFSSGTLISTFINFATAILVIRWLGIEDYGQLVLALSVYAIASIFLDPGIGGLIVSEVAKGRGDQQLGKVKLFLMRYGQMQLALGVILFLVMFFVFSLLEVFIILIIGIYLFFTGIKNIFVTSFFSHTLYHYQVLIDVIQSIGRLILVILLLGWFKMGLVGAMVTYPLSLMLAIMFIAPFWLKSLSYLKKIEIQKGSIFSILLKEQGKFAVLVTPVKQIHDQVPVWILKGILGLEAVAIYGVAQKMFAFLFSFYKSLEATIFPLTSEMVRSQWTNVKEMVGRSIKYSLWISLLVVPLGWAVAPFLFEIVFPNVYIASIPVFRLFLLFLFIYSFTLLIQRPLFFALGALKYHFYCYLLSFGFYSFTLWLLISQMGISGAVWALIINGVVIGYLRFYFIRKIKPDFKTNVRGLFHFDAFDKEMFKKGRQHIFGIETERVG